MKKRRCAKQVHYATREEAEAAIESMARRFGNFVFKRPYRCGRCKAWHVTSTPPWSPGRRIQH
jgi:hypothetical protein